jgi:glycosyltransferase involved in cell wall biosynthesis
MPNLLSLNTYNYRRGGSDAVYFDHDELFVNASWETAVFTMHHPNNRPSPWSRYFVDELEFGHDYSLKQKLLMAGKVIYSWEAQAKLSKLLESFNPDIAHAHCIYHHLSPSVLQLLRKKGIPTVMTAHDLKLACPAYKMLNESGICEKCKHGNLTHLIFHRCIHNSLSASTLVALESGIHKTLKLYKKNLDRIVAPSQFFRDKLIEWGWSADQIVYIPNFLEFSKYTPRYNPGDYFLYFGRLAPEKGVDTLIRAAAQAKISLKIAGTGPYEADLLRIADEVNGDIEFLGYCSGNNLHELIKNSRAVVLPSEWYENAPISVLEAYACGKPLIGSKIGGIPEMVIENQTGFLFKSGDVNQLSELLSNFSNKDDNFFIDMGRFARKFLEENFTPNHYRDKMINLYNSLM